MTQNRAAPVAAEDAAWAAINTPLSVDALNAFCQDIERLYRINPMLEFKQWQVLGDERFLLKAKNISQETPVEVMTEITVTRNSNEIVVHYLQGIKTTTTFKIEASEYGSRLTIIDEYVPLSADDARLAEVDKSLTVWAEYLQRFIIMWRRWSRFGWWRWYMRRVWQPMKPAARRITYMFWWITLVEVTLIALGAAIYWAEYT